ncbi:hypothetical protein Tco_0737635 [Tanacetum coccineum]
MLSSLSLKFRPPCLRRPPRRRRRKTFPAEFSGEVQNGSSSPDLSAHLTHSPPLALFPPPPQPHTNTTTITTPAPPPPSSPHRPRTTIPATTAVHHKGCVGFGSDPTRQHLKGAFGVIPPPQRCVWVDIHTTGCVGFIEAATGAFGLVKPPEKGAFVVGQPPPEEGASGCGLAQKGGVHLGVAATALRGVCWLWVSPQWGPFGL